MTLKLIEGRDEKCQEVTELDLWVGDQEPEGVGEWDVEQAEAEWVETVPEQDLWGIVCVPPAEQKSRIQQGHHVMI
ncbi:MAG: hypothetical protein AB1393_07010 [Candidatus Edwardsbacteria bacterium]